MKIRYMSDLHLEFETYHNGEPVFPNTFFDIPTLNDDNETVLILAGDVGLIAKPYTYLKFFEKIHNRFKAIIYVPGNHEYYHDVLGMGFDKLKQSLQDLNVHLMNNSSIRIDNQLFVGATLWTDFDNGNPISLMKATGYMSDFTVIRHVNEYGSVLRVTPEYIYELHKQSLDYLIQTLANTNGAIVVTHHLPSFKSVNVGKWGYHYSNHYYFSDLDEMIMTYNPKLWVHGHTHDTCDYMIGETRVLCNPRGYLGHELNYNFDDKALVII